MSRATNTAGMRAVARAFLSILSDYTDTVWQTRYEAQDRVLGDRLRNTLWELNKWPGVDTGELERMDARGDVVGAIAMGEMAQANGSWGVAIGPFVVAERGQVVVDLDWLRETANPAPEETR